jgi:competence protein ComEC
MHPESYQKPPVNFFKVGIGLFLVIIILTFGIWQTLRTEHSSKLLISFLDVGQGDGIYIKSPNGIEVVIDGGPDQKILSELGAMRAFFDRTIDMIVVTNPDKDHYAGFIDILGRYKIKQLIEPGTLSSTPTYQAFKEKIKAKGVEEIIGKRNDKIILDKDRNIYFEVLFPDRDASGMSSNEGSLVMKLVYGETCVMLQGDSVSGIEEYLLSTHNDNVSCQILKTGHHGSRTSTSKTYVKAVSPEFAILSLGKENRYGHPHKEVLQVLEDARVQVLRTDLLGRITFVSDGMRWQRQ